MPKYLLIIVVFIPGIVSGQSILAKRYVDDRINENTYLYFKPDSTFEFRYSYDIMGDEAVGRYTLHKDTLLLVFTKDTNVAGRKYFEKALNVRVDSLIVKRNKLYELKNCQSKEYQLQDTLHHKPPKNLRWQYRHKYIFWGVWQTHWSRYYMIDERYAKWANKKWVKKHNRLFD